MIAHLLACTLVSLAAVGASMALRGRAGAWRHALLLLAMLRFAVPTTWLASSGASLATYAPARVGRIEIFDRLAGLFLLGIESSVIPAPVAAQARNVLNPWIFVWAAGLGLCLTRWLRIMLRQIPGVRKPTLAELQALERAQVFFAGISAHLQIAAPAQAPGVRGIWRPEIILPDGLSAKLSAAELDAVLVHELAHVRRWDNLTAAIAHLVACVCWFYPMTWWLERRMLNEREAACDQMALAHGVDAAEYLAGLLKVCRMSFASATGYAGAGGSNFQNRLENIMSGKSQRPSWGLRLAASVVVALAVMIPVSGAFLKAQNVQHPLPAAPSQAPLVSPTTAQGQIEAGQAMLQSGNFGGAEESFRMAHSLEPGNAKAMMGIAEALMAEGKSDEAVAFLREEVAIAGARLDLRLALANTEVRAKKYDLALNEFQRILTTLDPNSSAAGDVHMRMAETYRRMGKSEEAIAELARIKQAPAQEAATATKTRALVFEGAGKWKDAIAAYRDVLRVDPEDAVSLNNLSYLSAEHGGNLEEALTMAQRARRLLPEMPEVADTVGWIDLKMNRSGDAVLTFRELIAKVPGTSLYHFHLAKAYLQQGDKLHARQEAESALRLNPAQRERSDIEDLLSVAR